MEYGQGHSTFALGHMCAVRMLVILTVFFYLRTE